MDGEIHFGDVEETLPQRQLRPDQNRHFAVVAYASPAQDDLRVYVDVDVMRDMEAHASSNTHVELGGVLLGGQHEDEDGNAFVVITDSLRQSTTKRPREVSNSRTRPGAISHASGTSFPRGHRSSAGTTPIPDGEYFCREWTPLSVIISSTNSWT